MDLRKTYLYRILHRDNLRYIIDHARLHAAAHPDADPNYIPIGDTRLTANRGNTRLMLPPGGAFRDYVSFYFGSRQPMLYCIKYGNSFVQKRPMEEIIYLATSVQEVVESGKPYIFFDGHSYDGFTTAYNDLASLEKVDLKAARAKYWSDEDDADLKRRKQAELVVHQDLELKFVPHIVVQNKSVEDMVGGLLKGSAWQPKLHVRPDLYF